MWVTFQIFGVHVMLVDAVVHGFLHTIMFARLVAGMHHNLVPEVFRVPAHILAHDERNCRRPVTRANNHDLALARRDGCIGRRRAGLGCRPRALGDAHRLTVSLWSFEEG